MILPDPPDLARPRSRLLLAALAAALFVGVTTALTFAPRLSQALGDTDDATRLYLVRSLLAGQGWWDQNIARLQPPRGVFMHWSRLLDGGIAGLDLLLRTVLPRAAAEWWTRLLWPLLWLFPAILAGLFLSDDLAGAGVSARRRRSAAPLVCLLFLITNFALYAQFRPGRIDHHDVQMALFLVALAGAGERARPRAGALVSGAAMGLGLAVGLEALVFDALIGAFFALRFVVNPDRGPVLSRFGAALAATAALAYLVQTPPGRWLLSACDALAFNSVAALLIAGLGCAVLGRLRLTGLGRRSAGVALIGAAAALAYLGFDPRCLRGPFADVDPAIKGFWLVHVQEMRPFPLLMKVKPDEALILAIPPVMAIIAAAVLATRPRFRGDPLFLLATALLLMTTAAGFNGVRMGGYADWMAMPVLALAAAELAEAAAARFRRDRLVTVGFAACLLTPELLTTGALEAQKLAAAALAPKPAPGAKTPAARKDPPDLCFATRPYALLAATAPPGLVLSEIDLGPFVLTLTPDSVLAAPYHRMSWGLVQARSILAADADTGAAEARARALGVSYVLECRGHARHTDREGMAANALQRRLDADRPPSWLEPLSPKGAPLQIFRVRTGARAGA